MSHTVSIRFDGFMPIGDFTCQAPGDAQCKAVWDCDCEMYFDYLVTDEGKPTHLPDPHDKYRWHTGRFDHSGCNYADWFSEIDLDGVKGTVTFEVEPEWQGSDFIFHVVRGDLR